MFALLAVMVVAVVLGLGFVAYNNINTRLTEIENADDAPHAIARSVQEASFSVKDLNDDLRRLAQRVEQLESRKIEVTERRDRGVLAP